MQLVHLLQLSQRLLHSVLHLILLIICTCFISLYISLMLIIQLLTFMREIFIFFQPLLNGSRKCAGNWLEEGYLIEMLVRVRLHSISLITKKKLRILLACIICGGYTEFGEVTARLLCALMCVSVLDSKAEHCRV